MASALINNASQIYFDYVFGMDNEGMVKMFKTLESSGLKGFLGCSSAIYEAALVEFFQNASVKDDKVVSTVQGKSVEFTKEVFAGTFELQTERLNDMGYGDSHDEASQRLCGADLYFVEGCTRPRLGGIEGFPTSEDYYGKDCGNIYCQKKIITVDVDEPAGDEPVVKKKAATKRRPAPAVAPKRRAPKRKLILPTGSDGEKEPYVEDAVEKERETTVVDDVGQIIVQVITETTQMEIDFVEPGITRSAKIELEHSIAVNDEDDNLDGAENEISRKMASFTAPKHKIIEPAKAEKDKEIEPVATEDLSLAKSVATMTDSEDTEPLSKALELTEKPSTSDEELMSLEDLLKQIPDDMLMPSVTAAEPTKIKFGQGIEIREVDPYKASLPQIAADDKGRSLLWRVYIIAKYREMLLRKFLEARCHNFVSDTPTTAIDLKVLDLLTAAHHFALKILLWQVKEHKLEWTRPYSSHLFEGTNAQPGVFIPRSNTKFKSTCWIRAMILVDGSWLIVEGVDYWRPISRPVDSHKWEMLPQRPYIDDLASLCAFVEPVKDLDSRSPFSRLTRDHWCNARDYDIRLDDFEFSYFSF
ncbi:splicing factor 3B subunit 1 [Dorcoceras hygrometricum]|uniref:Splicing factor 3B subunit 1 n=1 Tax=Dorcoceras hygrometricum TaxID=472368 RepID=A0A2Z7A2I8_9LAMI|nr:splicing factor 3B subunit 1 [Dorcoceras hygrometricum]